MSLSLRSGRLHALIPTGRSRMSLTFVRVSLSAVLFVCTRSWASSGGLTLLKTPLFALPSVGRALGAPAQLSVDAPQGLPKLSIGGAMALSSVYTFWNKDWACAPVESQLNVDAPLTYCTVARNISLDFDLKTAVRRRSPQEVTWRFELHARRQIRDAIGGGLSGDIKFRRGDVRGAARTYVFAPSRVLPANVVDAHPDNPTNRSRAGTCARRHASHPRASIAAARRGPSRCNSHRRSEPLAAARRRDRKYDRHRRDPPRIGRTGLTPSAPIAHKGLRDGSVAG
jgi:hypothetical protein